MTNQIDLSLPVATIVDQHPEVLDILVELGFKPLANPALRTTLGRVTSIKAGAKMAGIDLAKITKTLRFNGYDVIGED